MFHHSAFLVFSNISGQPARGTPHMHIKWWAPGLVKSVPAVAYLLCLALPGSFLTVCFVHHFVHLGNSTQPSYSTTSHPVRITPCPSPSALHDVIYEWSLGLLQRGYLSRHDAVSCHSYLRTLFQLYFLTCLSVLIVVCLAHLLPILGSF